MDTPMQLPIVFSEKNKAEWYVGKTGNFYKAIIRAPSPISNYESDLKCHYCGTLSVVGNILTNTSDKKWSIPFLPCL